MTMKTHPLGIYCIRNLINNKVYIGQAIDIETRLRHHKESLARGDHHSQYLQRAWDKFGIDAFEFSILEECEESGLNDRESYYIETVFKSRDYKNGYNSREAGSKGRHSAEARRKMSASTKGQIISKETREKLSIAFSGCKNPMYGRKSPMLGKKHSAESKVKISAAHKGRPKSESTKKKLRVSLTGKLVGERNPFYGHTHSPKLKKHWSEMRIGVHPSDETRLKMSLSQKGRVFSDESKTKMSQSAMGEKNPFYGKHHSLESRQKMSQAQRKYDENTVKLIRTDIEQGITNSEIQKKYNIAKSTLRKIKLKIFPYQL